MIYVVLIRRRYVEMILDGTKTVECRLSRQRRDPFEKVSPGDLLYIKEVAGPVRARGVVSRTLSLRDLAPADVATLRRRYNNRIHADAEFWTARRHARYATLVFIANVRVCDHAPEYRNRPGFSPRAAWHVLSPAPAKRSA